MAAVDIEGTEAYMGLLLPSSAVAAVEAVVVGAKSSWRTSCFKAEEPSFIDCYLAINFIKEWTSCSSFSWAFNPSFTTMAAIASATVEQRC